MISLVRPALPLAALLAMAAGCGNAVEEPVCTPPCAAGATCTTGGCVGGEERDLATTTDDMSLAICAPACSGATPHCNAKRVCVACLDDAHCPTGQICKVLGESAACVPGCTDDTRCGGAGMKCCGGRCTDTAGDPRNCGACDNVCASANARAVCAAGTCGLGNCNAGWGDCNANPADGCEAYLRSDDKNCTACGMACSIPNAITGCADGCYVRACAFGFDDCDGMPMNGCELNVLSNNQNCGACGNPCPGVPHARNNCVNGSCQLISCDPGYADCDGNSVNGCEVTVATDFNNCGGCGTRCAQGLVCSQGLCTCPQCNLPNAKSTCVNLQCVVASCSFGWGNCDGQAQNGCERNLSSDAQNCGACGVACGQGLICVNSACTCPNCILANAQSSCVNNVCKLDSCSPGWGNCDGNIQNGCEKDVTADVNNCGGCGVVCPGGNTCNGGQCKQISCMRIGWQTGNANWNCPNGLRLPNMNEFNSVQPCLLQQDLNMFGAMNDIAISVGGCNCKWNANWCGQPSIESMRQGRMCGDFQQLMICVN